MRNYLFLILVMALLFPSAISAKEVGSMHPSSGAIWQLPNGSKLLKEVNALGDLGGGTDDIDLHDGDTVSATVSTSTQTFTFSNPPGTGYKGELTLVLTNGGSQTINWPASVDWEGAAPTLTASGIDVLYFFTIDGGTTWYGFTGGLDMQ
jgi:hypothetical protein